MKMSTVFTVASIASGLIGFCLIVIGPKIDNNSYSGVVILPAYGISLLLAIIAVFLLFVRWEIVHISGIIKLSLLLLMGITLVVLTPMAIKRVMQESGEISARKNRTKALGEIIIKYAHKHDGNLPASENWCDLLIKDDASLVGLKHLYFTNPVVEGNYECNFALNANVGGLNIKNIPPNCVILFEADGPWNISGDETLFKRRYIEKSFRSSYVFLSDGSCQVFYFKSGLIEDASTHERPYKIILWKAKGTD